MSKKRILIYVCCLIAAFFSVIIKRNIVTRKRNKEIISTFSQWQKYGKPVFVKVIAKRDVKMFSKITTVLGSKGEYESYVPKVIQEKLAAGQDVFEEGSDTKAIGKISAVSETVAIDTGMFHVALALDRSFGSNIKKIVYVNTGTFSEAICIPNDVIDKEGDDHVLWVVKNGHAHKNTVTLRERNGYGAIVEKGLQEGDLLIVDGFTSLSENDKVHILNISEFGEI